MCLAGSTPAPGTPTPAPGTPPPPVQDGNEDRTIPQGSSPLNLNLLDNAVPPPGTTAAITSFTLPGSSTAYPAGPNPVTITDPVSGNAVGSIVVRPDGSTTFTPVATFSGQVPPVSYTVKSSDGQTTKSVLSVVVTPGAQHHWPAGPCASQSHSLVCLA